MVLKNLKINLEEQFEDKSESENNKLKGAIPLVRIRQPKQQKIQWPLNQLDYQNLNNFVGSDYFKEHLRLTTLEFEYPIGTFFRKRIRFNL